MDIQSEIQKSEGVRYRVMRDGKEIAHAYIHLIKNDRHEEPYGLLENVFVNESKRGNGIGTEFLKHIFDDAKKRGCYKLIGTSRNSRPKVHALYKRLGFEEWGKEFRMNLHDSEVLPEE